MKCFDIAVPAESLNRKEPIEGSKRVFRYNLKKGTRGIFYLKLSLTFYIISMPMVGWAIRGIW